VIGVKCFESAPTRHQAPLLGAGFVHRKLQPLGAASWWIRRRLVPVLVLVFVLARPTVMATSFHPLELYRAGGTTAIGQPLVYSARRASGRRPPHLARVAAPTIQVNFFVEPLQRARTRETQSKFCGASPTAHVENDHPVSMSRMNQDSSSD
jgi:hypothetical protein